MNKLTPIQLAMAIDPNYTSPPHLRLLQKYVAELLASPGQAKLIIQLPIRHGKSEFCSKWLPTWYLLNYPQKNVILTGYSGDFAREWGGKVLRNVKAYGRYYGVELGDSQRQELWTLKAGGGMRTCGTQGAISGRGSDLLISDDQCKDQQQANSPTSRDSLWTWFQADALSRLSPTGKALVILSRRHPDDLVGRLLQTDTGWRTLRLPALAEEEDELGRKPGEALWSTRFSADQLADKKIELELAGTSYIWDCLYQQNPSGDPASKEWSDSYFDSIWSSMPTENIRLRVLACDPSKGKGSDTSDYCAFVYLVLTTDGTYYVQSYGGRMPVDQIGQMATKLIDQLRPDAFSYEGAFMSGFMPNTHAYLFDPSRLGDKKLRIRVHITPFLASKRLKLDANNHLNKLLLAQMKEFPGGRHDDYPDALAQALYMSDQLLHGKKPNHQNNLVLGV